MKKLFVLFLIVFVATQVMTTSLDNEQEWMNFKVKFNRNYEGVEDSNRMKIFLENKRIIDEHNAKYDNGEVSYKMGLNKFSDMTQEEFKKSMGLRS